MNAATVARSALVSRARRALLPTARGAVVLLAAAALSACAALGPRIEAPRITVDSVRIEKLDGPDAYFAVGVSLANPNDRAIAVDAIAVDIAIEGERVADAALAAPVRLPANGNASADLRARAGVDALLRVAASAMRRGVVQPGRPPTLRYSIDGRATLEGGLQVPFARSGELGLGPAGPSAGPAK